MHEGEHGIIDLGGEHEHDHRPTVQDRRAGVGRIVAASVVAASVVLFLVWRFL
ncbi:MAG: hypothetical protein RDU83_11660 [bacterium]|nr:hypothetical protein [bacterium]